MELHHRVELIDTLIEETDQKTQSLHHALHARERAEQTKGSSHGAPLTEEEQGLQFLKDRELCRLLVRKTK